MRDCLEYPEIVKSKLKIVNTGDTRWNHGKKTPIENPKAMGIDKIVKAAFREYQDGLKIPRKEFVADRAEEALLEFESDAGVIRDRQLTMQYFYDNDELRDFVNTVTPPKDIFSFGISFEDIQGRSYKIYENEKLFADYMRRLEEKIVEPSSEAMQNVKRFLQETIEHQIPELERQLAESEDYTVVLKVPGRRYWAATMTATNSEGHTLDLEEFMTNEHMNRTIKECTRKLVEVLGIKARKLDSIEVTLTGLNDLKIEALTRRLGSSLGRKSKREDFTADEDIEYLKDVLVKQLGGSCLSERVHQMNENERYLFDNISHFFFRFWHQIKYYAHMAEYFHKLEDAGYPLCMPEVAPIEERVMHVKDGYSINLIRNMEREEVVPNDINLGEDGTHVYLITGPNKNGKTTFLNMCMGFQAAFQAGWFLPASQARISPKAGIKSFYTEIVTEDDAESRFSHDAKRLKGLFERIEDYDVIPMDEPVTATNADFIQTYLQEVVRDVLPHAPNVTFIMTSHEHSLIDVVEQLDCAQNLKCVTHEQNGRIIRTHRIVPGYSTVSNADDLMEEYGADPAKLREYMRNSAEEGKLTFKP